MNVPLIMVDVAIPVITLMGVSYVVVIVDIHLIATN